ncbi:hypothetical protein QUB10_01100 [Microcoleus sp. B5-D4]|uniref:hypothetical protein n=1 Tax=unclassified Microcoleus TaxID=2642155 RepID=UPI002FCEEDB1
MAELQKSPNLIIQTVADLEFPGGPIPLDSRFGVADLWYERLNMQVIETSIYKALGF